jgi:parvulin-like peptidyl-prolyl isomerase
MKVSTITLAVLGATLALVAASCGGGGGGSDVPSGAVAVVDGTEIPRSELDTLIERAKTATEASKQDFPKVGTPEYQSIQTQYLAFLVQREQFEQAADELGVKISDKDVDKAVDDFVKSRFDGNRREYERALKQQGLSEADFKETVATSVLSQKIFDKVTEDVKVSDADLLGYYNQNIAQYRTPASRDVRHILIAEKNDEGQIDFAKSKTKADQLYTELENGADFAALAKKHSGDPGSKDSGGKLTISQGQTVPEFDKTAFELKEGVVSRPVKTTYGYHLIEALSPVRKEKVTKFGTVRDSIRATLLQERRTEVMQSWVNDLREKYEGKVSYAAGFEPPELPAATTDTTTTN